MEPKKKMKTKKRMAKSVSISANWCFMHKRVGRNHFLAKKKGRRILSLMKKGCLSVSNSKVVKKMLNM